MFASNNNNNNNMMHEEEYEDPVDELIHYFSTLQPYTPPEPLEQSPLVTPSATAWASFPQTLMDAELVADEFLNIVDERQKQKQQLDHNEEIQPTDPLSSANLQSQTEATLGTGTETTTTTAKSPAESISAAALEAAAEAAAEEAFESILDPLRSVNMMYLTSVLRKRRIKMRKHKYKKLRKRTRALRKKLGK
ncbi:hypothetical protein EDD21DRAFT_391906 [Dissophora ornata]|nr:hypothetical protein EDD21DRAFT_391906 [Dissophora ornata]